MCRLNAPPTDLRLWIAAIRVDEEHGHCVVARDLTGVYDPVPADDGLCGQTLLRSFGYDLIDSFELVRT